MTLQRVWSRRAAFYDWIEGSDLRRGPYKRALFSRARGRVLLIGAGTGLDLRHLKASDVTAIDISAAMISRARGRAVAAPARVGLIAADAHYLPFAQGSFDTIITSCTMCSVTNPIGAFVEMRRVLTRAGRLLMFEHVRSQHPLLALTLDAMTLWTRRSGTDMNRDTIAAAQAAGFTIIAVDSVYLDIILAIEAVAATARP